MNVLTEGFCVDIYERNGDAYSAVVWADGVELTNLNKKGLHDLIQQLVADEVEQHHYRWYLAGKQGKFGLTYWAITGEIDLTLDEMRSVGMLGKVWELKGYRSFEQFVEESEYDIVITEPFEATNSLANFDRLVEAFK